MCFLCLLARLRPASVRYESAVTPESATFDHVMTLQRLPTRRIRPLPSPSSPLPHLHSSSSAPHAQVPSPLASIPATEDTRIAHSHRLKSSRQQHATTCPRSRPHPHQRSMVLFIGLFPLILYVMYLLLPYTLTCSILVFNPLTWPRPRGRANPEHS